ncbi:unnamed protein product [Amoebophrya sp. A25]|nr:unnamed protein product [Amoebophrya sp. A25]|eukprot:GSA25T00016227001.1
MIQVEVPTATAAEAARDRLKRNAAHGRGVVELFSNGANLPQNSSAGTRESSLHRQGAGVRDKEPEELRQVEEGHDAEIVPQLKTPACGPGDTGICLEMEDDDVREIPRGNFFAGNGPLFTGFGNFPSAQRRKQDDWARALQVESETGHETGKGGTFDEAENVAGSMTKTPVDSSMDVLHGAAFRKRRGEDPLQADATGALEDAFGDVFEVKAVPRAAVSGDSTTGLDTKPNGDAETRQQEGALVRSEVETAAEEGDAVEVPQSTMQPNRAGRPPHAYNQVDDATRRLSFEDHTYDSATAPARGASRSGREGSQGGAAANQDDAEASGEQQEKELKRFALRLLRDERGETELSDEVRTQYTKIRQHIAEKYLPMLQQECALMHQAHSTWVERVNAGYLPQPGVFELRNPFPDCHQDLSLLDLPEDLSTAASLTAGGRGDTSTKVTTAQAAMELLTNRLRKGFYMVLDYVDDSIPLDAVPSFLNRELFPELHETYMLPAFSYFYPYPEEALLEELEESAQRQVSSYIYARVFNRLQSALLFLHSTLNLIHNDVQGGNILLRKSALRAGVRKLYALVADVLVTDAKLQLSHARDHQVEAGRAIEVETDAWSVGTPRPGFPADRVNNVEAKRAVLRGLFPPLVDPATGKAMDFSEELAKQVVRFQSARYGTRGQMGDQSRQNQGRPAAASSGSVASWWPLGNIDVGSWLGLSSGGATDHSARSSQPHGSTAAGDAAAYYAGGAPANADQHAIEEQEDTATSIFPFLEVTIIDFGLCVPKHAGSTSFAFGFALPLKHFCLLRRDCRHLSLPVDDMFALGITFLALLEGPRVLRWPAATETDRVTNLRLAWRDAVLEYLPELAPLAPAHPAAPSSAAARHAVNSPPGSPDLLSQFDAISPFRVANQRPKAKTRQQKSNTDDLAISMNQGEVLYQEVPEQQQLFVQQQQEAASTTTQADEGLAGISVNEWAKKVEATLVCALSGATALISSFGTEYYSLSTILTSTPEEQRGTMPTLPLLKRPRSPMAFLLFQSIHANLFLDRVEAGDSVYDDLSALALRLADTTVAFRHAPLPLHNEAETLLQRVSRGWALTCEVVHLCQVQFWVLWANVPKLALILVFLLVFSLLAAYTLLLLLGWYLMSGRVLKEWAAHEPYVAQLYDDEVIHYTSAAEDV